MNITRSQLRRIIKEELEAVMSENEDAEEAAYDKLASCTTAVMMKLLDDGVDADEASNIVFRAVKETVQRLLL